MSFRPRGCLREGPACSLDVSAWCALCLLRPLNHSGNMRMAVALPEGEDLNEWLAVNSKCLSLRLWLLRVSG